MPPAPITEFATTQPVVRLFGLFSICMLLSIRFFARKVESLKEYFGHQKNSHLIRGVLSEI